MYKRIDSLGGREGGETTKEGSLEEKRELFSMRSWDGGERREGEGGREVRSRRRRSTTEGGKEEEGRSDGLRSSVGSLGDRPEGERGDGRRREEKEGRWRWFRPGQKKYKGRRRKEVFAPSFPARCCIRFSRRRFCGRVSSVFYALRRERKCGKSGRGKK